MIHMMSLGVSETAQQDLEYVARTLFKMEDQAGGCSCDQCHVIYVWPPQESYVMSINAM